MYLNLNSSSISCLNTIETSEPASNSRRSGRGETLSAGSWALNARWRPGAHISENEANFQIDVMFINKRHIWSLNNYILA